MDLDTELDLAEAAKLLGVRPEKLIRWGANGKLMISVMAEDWSVRTENGTAKIINCLVDLLPEDLRPSYNADSTRVRKVKTLDEGDVFMLDQPVELLRGKLFVAADEFRRFRRNSLLPARSAYRPKENLSPNRRIGDLRIRTDRCLQKSPVGWFQPSYRATCSPRYFRNPA